MCRDDLRDALLKHPLIESYGTNLDLKIYHKAFQNQWQSVHTIFIECPRLQLRAIWEYLTELYNLGNVSHMPLGFDMGFCSTNPDTTTLDEQYLIWCEWFCG